MKTQQILLYGGAALVIYELFLKQSGGPSLLPGSTQTTQSLPQGQGGQLVAVNTGNGIANYAQLVAANPHLADPNYTMTAAENSQYLANYLDLQEGLPLWIGHKQANGQTPKNIAQAAQIHWNEYGANEHRVFVPLQPPSTKPFVQAAHPASSGSGSSWLSAVVPIVTTAITALAGIDKRDNPVEKLILQAAPVANEVLQLFRPADHAQVDAIKAQYDQTILKIA